MKNILKWKWWHLIFTVLLATSILYLWWGNSILVSQGILGIQIPITLIFLAIWIYVVIWKTIRNVEKSIKTDSLTKKKKIRYYSTIISYSFFLVFSNVFFVMQQYSSFSGDIKLGIYLALIAIMLAMMAETENAVQFLWETLLEN
ncbi:Uncharacterised protein [Candidatus Anstonella stagnisolia]|nr:Uncharacterised protein [Candidatus Anstonella stagnisolia]